MAQVLGRVVTGVHEAPRGPDVTHRIAVVREWLLEGETVELTLPRNLACAACEGGGCDRCGRAGAITLRERSEAPETVRITLPRRTAEELDGQPSFVLRLPDLGGASAERADLPRGLLLLKIAVSATPPSGLTLVRQTAAARAPEAASLPSDSPVSQARPRKSVLGWALVAIALLAMAWLFLLSASATRP